MLYNKSKYRKVNDKKVLHKIGKRWVTLSIAMLALLGGGAAASHVTHAASTTPVAKPAVNRPANNANSAKTKLVNPQSVSSSAKSQSASVSSSAVSSSKSILSKDSTTSNSSSVSDTSTVNKGNNHSINGLTTDNSGLKSSKPNHLNLMLEAPDNSSNTNSSQLSNLLNINSILSLVNNKIKTGNNTTEMNNAYDTLLNSLSYTTLNKLNTVNNGNGAEAAGTDNITWYNYISNLLNSINTLGIHNDALDKLSSNAGFVKTALNIKGAHQYNYANVKGIITRYLGTSSDIATQMQNVISSMNSIASLTGNNQNQYNNVINDLRSLPHQTSDQQNNTLNDIENNAGALESSPISSVINWQGVVSEAKTAAENNHGNDSVNDIIQYVYNGHNVSSISLNGDSGSKIVGSNYQYFDNIKNGCPGYSTALSEATNITAMTYNGQTYKIDVTPSENIINLKYGSELKKTALIPFEDGGTMIPYGDSDLQTYVKQNLPGYVISKSYDMFPNGGSHDVQIVHQDTINYVDEQSHQVIGTQPFDQSNANDASFDLTKSTPNLNLPSNYRLANADNYIPYDGRLHTINVIEQSTDDIEYFDGSNYIGNTQKVTGDQGTTFNLTKSNAELPAGYQLANANNYIPYDGEKHTVNIIKSVNDTIKYMDGNTPVGKEQTFTGGQGTSFDLTNANATLPSKYQLASADNNIKYDGNTHTVNVTLRPVTDTIQYMNGNTQVGNMQTFSGKPGNSFNLTKSNAELPTGYDLANTTNPVNYDGQPHKIAVEPDSEQVTVKYIDTDNNGIILDGYNSNNIQKSISSTYNANINDVTSDFAIPTGYHYVSGKKNYLVNNNQHQEVDIKIAGDTGKAIPVEYINQNGQKAGNSQINGSIGQTGNAVNNASAPNGYTINDGQSLAYTIKGVSQNPIKIDVTGNDVTRPFTVNVNKNVNGHNNSRIIKHVNVNGKIGDTFNITPNNYTPNGYTSNRSNQEVNGTITSNGLSITNATFEYDANNGVPIVVNYYNQNDQNVGNGRINGKVDETGSINNQVPVPTGYTVNRNQPSTYKISNVSQSPIEINVTGKTESGNVSIIINEHNGNTNDTYTYPSKALESGRVGDAFTVNAPVIPGYGQQELSKNGEFTPSGLNPTQVSFNYEYHAGAPITVNYINQTGKTISSSTITGYKGKTGTITPIAPKGYTVKSSQPITYRISNQVQPINIPIVGNRVTRNFTIYINKNVNGQVTPSNASKSIQGHVGDTFTINPNDYVPTGYTSSSDNQIVNDVITPNGLKLSNTTFNYNANTGAPVTVSYINQIGKDVKTNQINGKVDEIGNIGDQVSVPTEYTVNQGQPSTYKISTNPQNITIRVTGEPAEYHVDYVVPTAYINSQEHGQTVGTSVMNGRIGDNGVVPNGANMPNGYSLDNDSTNVEPYAFDGSTHKVDVLPNRESDTVVYKDGMNTVLSTMQHGLFGNIIPNQVADNYNVVGIMPKFNDTEHTVNVSPKTETFTINYVYNSIPQGHSRITKPYNSNYVVNGNDVPQYYRLANGASTQVVVLNNNPVQVAILPKPMTPTTSASLINGLLNIAKDVNDNSINSYRNLVHIMQPNTLHDLTHNGIEVGTTSDSASDNTILGYINSVCKDVINISNNAPSDTSLKNGLAAKLQKAQDMMNQQSNLLNSGESLASSLYKTNDFNLSFMGERLSNPGGFAHSLLQGILGADIDPLGMGANTLNTILNNASTSSHYQNVINDLGELVPSQHALQQSRILNDVAHNVQAIANDPSMRHISNLDPARSGKAVSTLQNSVPSIIQASQDYLSPKYNDTDVINYQNNGNTVNSVTKTGLDGSQITGVSAPADYVIATDPGNLMFVKNGNYNVAVKPVQKTDTINYRYSGHILTKQFTGSVLDKLVINNVPEGGPTDYHVVGNPEFNYDGLTHDVSLQRNAAGYSNDNVDYVVNDSNSQNNGRVLAHVTMYGQNGTSAQVPASRVPAGYHLANDSTDRITFSNASVSHRADIRPDDNETDTVKYTYQGQQIGSEVTFNNGIYDNDIRVPAPAHYSLVNNSVITINGRDHNVQVVPNTVHDTIDYKYDGQLIGNPETVNGAYGTKGSVTPLANYSLVNNNETITFDNGHHDVQVTPNQITETVNFVDGNGNSVSSSNVNGTYGTTIDVSSVVPADYKLASGSAEVKLDNQPKTLVVDQIPQPSHDTDNPSTNTDITGGGSIPTPSVPVMPLGPVGPSPMSPQSSASSSIPSESAQPSYVAPSSYQPSDYVAPSASATPKKHAAKANVINIPSLDRHPYVKVGARDVRINPKAIKHAKVLGTVQRGRKIAYRIKVGKVTGYVFGTAKRIPKTALMNGHKRAYVHVGRKTIKLTAKNLKHVRILKTVQKGHNVKFYVKINHKHGSVYARVSVKNYKFDIPKTYNTKYYRVLPKQRHYVKIVKPICIYRSYRFNDHARRGHISSGITVRVKRIVYNHGVTRFELTNGKFITANKGCVKVI